MKTSPAARIIVGTLIAILIVSMTLLVPAHASGQGNPKDEILSALNDAMSQGRYLKADFVNRLDIAQAYFSADQSWAVVTVMGADDDPGGGGYVLAHYDHSAWELAFPLEPAFANWMHTLPQDLLGEIDQDFQTRVDSYRRVSPQTLQDVAQPLSGFRFPWENGKDFSVSYDAEDHMINESVYAYDFRVGDNTPLLAAKSGVVLKAKYSSNTGGCNATYASDANWVVIDHGDGTVASYAHLHHSDTQIVKVGEHIARGQLIGYSGNTGWSCGSHLHFVVHDSSDTSVFGNATNTHHILFDNPSGPPSQANPVDPEGTLVGTNEIKYKSSNKPPAVILYENTNFEGRILPLYDTDYDLCYDPLDPNVPLSGPCAGPSWNDIAASLRVTAGYAATLHIHNQADADKWHDDDTASYICKSDIADMNVTTFPNSVPLKQVSRIIIDKCPNAQQAKVSSLDSLSTATGNPCDPVIPPSSLDSVTFVSDLTLPDGMIVSPSQALTKTWRVKNTGTTTWGSGYQLAFVSGEQMGGPAAANIPSTASGQTADLSINITSPSAAGLHTGYFQLRNPGGTYFGPKFYVKIYVSSPSGYITLLTADPASPANASKVRFHAKEDKFDNFRAMRLLVDGQLKYELGAPEIYYDWDTAGYAAGAHSIVVEVADQTDTSWNHPQRKAITYMLLGSTTVTNHAPNRPIPTSPYDWLVYYSGSTANLCAQSQGDPDNDAISAYYFEVHDSAQSWNSGWTENSCVTTSSLAAFTYQWHVKVRDSKGAESEWSPDFHFTVVNQNLSISSFSLDSSGWEFRKNSLESLRHRSGECRYYNSLPGQQCHQWNG